MSRLWRPVTARRLRRRSIHCWRRGAGLRYGRIRSGIRRARHVGRGCGRFRWTLPRAVTIAIDLWNRRGGGGRPFRLPVGVDGAGYRWRCGALIRGAASRRNRRFVAGTVHGLVPIWIRLAVRLGGGTVVRTGAATTTRGTSTFVHAAVLSKGGLLRLLARLGPTATCGKFAVMLVSQRCATSRNAHSRNRSESSWIRSAVTTRCGGIYTLALPYAAGSVICSRGAGDRVLRRGASAGRRIARARIQAATPKS
jgi:hypothetical protein